MLNSGLLLGCALYNYRSVRLAERKIIPEELRSERAFWTIWFLATLLSLVFIIAITA